MIGDGKLFTKAKSRDHIITMITIVVFLAIYFSVSTIYELIANMLHIPFSSYIRPSIAIPISFVLVAGSIAVLGVSFGYILFSILTLTAGVETLFIALAYFYLAYASYRLWGNFESFSGDNIPPDRSLASMKEFILVSAIASSGAAAIVAWGHEVGAIAPFFVSVVVWFVSFFVSNIVFGLPFFVGLSILFEGKEGLLDDFFNDQWQHNDTPVTVVIIITLGWITIGTIGSIGYRLFERIPRDTLIVRDLQFLLLLDQPEIETGAGRLQTVFGAVMFSVLLFAYVQQNKLVAGKQGSR